MSVVMWQAFEQVACVWSPEWVLKTAGFTIRCASQSIFMRVGHTFTFAQTVRSCVTR